MNFLRAMLTMLGAYVVMYALPQWLEDACHMNAGVSGMFIIPMGGGGRQWLRYPSRRSR